ncbi:hypothetical protein ACQ27_gp362 [Klebsiella phage K64-1]|nr:hypothetical protein ACQ27_gp362 [Klebsiella phage K64-1]
MIRPICFYSFDSEIENPQLDNHDYFHKCY